ncbi:MAG: retron system putative HNH endonuclease [Hylemonella sp.]|nr:retron system putative HNH endonuclease [Hylemonella sp.]
MKKIKKSVSPPELANHLNANPNDDWDQFCGNNRDGKEAVQSRLRSDQRGVCAYCEIELAQFHGRGLDDFRIEHFHPKERPPYPPPNWALDWDNLIAVCTGGNSRYIGDAGLFTSPDHSCDVPKGNQNLVGVILDPTSDIPAYPPLFEFDEQGGMSVGNECPVDIRAKAQNTIDCLRLDPACDSSSQSPRLRRFRKVVIDGLRQKILEITNTGEDIQAAADELASIFFPNEGDASWPSFFSCIRWYLGPAAEARLRAIGYDG